ncbi:MAG: efflux transporter outer membrane subunit [Alphaproteobacteria bacterium]
MAVLAVLLTASCTKVGPDFETPEAKVSSDWVENEGKELPETPFKSDKWWEALGDPTLNRLIEAAYKSNYSLQVAGVRILEARAQLGIAIGQSYPQQQALTGDYTAARQSPNSSTAVPIPGFQTLNTQSVQFGLTASWEIDFWGKFRRAIESADASLMSSIAAYDAALVTLTGDVASTYITIRTFEERIRIARANVEIQKESLRIANVRYEEGETSLLDVEQALTELAQTEAQIPGLETSLRQAKNALAVLLGIPPAQVRALLEGPSRIPAAPSQIAVGIPKDLLRRRPDVRQAELVAASQSAQIGVAKAQLYPAFSLVGFFGFASSNVGSASLGDVFSWGSRTGSIGPSMTFPFLNYGQLTNQVRAQDANFQQAVLTYQNTVLTAQKEVEDGLATYLMAQQSVARYREAVRSAAKSADLALVRYREGQTDYTTVLTAQQQLLAVQDNLAISLGNVPQGLVSVYRALGGGWELRDGNDFVPDDVKQAMAKRTDWGNLLDPANHQAPTQDQRDALIRAPDW